MPSTLAKRKYGGAYGRRTRMRYTPLPINRLRIQKPEMKMRSYTLNVNTPSAAATSRELTGIAQGSDVANRVGNKVRIWRVEIRGNAIPGSDLYLVQSHNASLPIYANFEGVIGGHILGNLTNTTFTEWKHMTTRNDNRAFKMVQRFPRGYVAKYQTPDSTGCVDNRLTFIQVNNTAGDALVVCSMRVWFTDE